MYASRQDSKKFGLEHNNAHIIFKNLGRLMKTKITVTYKIIYLRGS